jgi:hypothetical protein
VDCGKIAKTLPDFQPQWTVRRGMEQLYQAFRKYALGREEFVGEKYLRIKRMARLLHESRLDATLRWSKNRLSPETVVEA